VAAWRRRRPGPRELVEALATLARRRAAGRSAAAVARWEQAGEAARRQRDLVWPIVKRALGRARVRVAAWRGDLGVMTEEGLARLFQQRRSLTLALGRQLDGLLVLLKGTVAEAQARWHPWKMAFGRRLVSLVLLAERNIADAAQRWKRR